jgi:NADH dehydrogenase FAD-containing subunit
MPSFEEPQTPFKVLILGGSYAGLSAALNLVDFCHGRKNRFSIDEADNGTGKVIPVQVTIVDPRDGFCMSPNLSFYIYTYTDNV